MQPPGRPGGKRGGGLLKTVLALALCGVFAAWFYELLEFSSEAVQHHTVHHQHDTSHHVEAPAVVQSAPVETAQIVVKEAPRELSEQAKSSPRAAYDPIDKRYWFYRRDVAEYLQRHFSPHRDVPAPVPPIAQKCPDATCSGNGACEPISGQCLCHPGWDGPSCKVPVMNGCNPDKGFWILSRCGGDCDMQMTTCHCPNHTKYPGRIMPADVHHKGADSRCPARAPSGEKPDWFSGDGRVYPKGYIWGPPGPEIQPGQPAWCDADPNSLTKEQKDKLHHDIWVKTDFHCMSNPEAWPCSLLLEPCLNSCSGNGVCRVGTCHCDPGFGGIDCAVRVAKDAKEQQKFIAEQAAAASAAAAAATAAPLQSFVPPKWLRRPLIYVYDIPTEFNMGLSRLNPWYCWYRGAQGGPNGIFWGMETLFPEQLLHSAHRTTDPEQADFFYVPVFDGCALALHHHNKRAYDRFPSGKRYARGMVMQEEALQFIRTKYPYWNRTYGRDHLFLAVADEGSCLSSGSVWNATFLTHWGNWADRPRSTSAYLPDEWGCTMAQRTGRFFTVDGKQRTLEDMRGVRPCYEPHKDIVVPSWKWSWHLPNMNWRAQANGDLALALQLEEEHLRSHERPLLFAFAGDFGGRWGRSERWYSQGIRFSLYTRFGNTHEAEFPEVKLISGHIKGNDGYNQLLQNATFCGAMPGDGYSARLEDSIINGCIPVIIQDFVHLAFESYLDFDAFTIRLPQIRMKDLVDILKAVPQEEIKRKREAVLALRRRFNWQSAVKKVHASKHLPVINATGRTREQVDFTGYDGRQDDPAVRPDATGSAEDTPMPFLPDAFGTIMEILAFKAVNDPWRLEYNRQRCAQGDKRKCEFAKQAEEQAGKHLGYLGNRTFKRGGPWGEVRKYGSACEEGGAVVSQRWAGPWDGEYAKAPEKGIPGAPPRTCVEDTPFIPVALDMEDCEMRLAGDLGCITFMNLGYKNKKIWPGGETVAAM